MSKNVAPRVVSTTSLAASAEIYFRVSAEDTEAAQHWLMMCNYQTDILYNKHVKSYRSLQYSHYACPL